MKMTHRRGCWRALMNWLEEVAVFAFIPSWLAGNFGGGVAGKCASASAKNTDAVATRPRRRQRSLAAGAEAEAAGQAEECLDHCERVGEQGTELGEATRRMSRGVAGDVAPQVVFMKREGHAWSP